MLQFDVCPRVSWRVTSQRRSCHLQSQQRSSHLLRWLLLLLLSPSSLSRQLLSRSVRHISHSGSAQAYGGELYWSKCSTGLLAKPVTIHFFTGQARATSEGKGFAESLCHTSAAETKRGWSRCQAEQPFSSNTSKWVFQPMAALKLIDILDKCLHQWHVS